MTGSERRAARFGKPRVSVVIPARNEAENLPFVVASVPDDVFAVLLVDGASTDETIAVTQSCRSDVRIMADRVVGSG
jgi:glycosyltransferase involved in cell wall biosynthesis